MSRFVREAFAALLVAGCAGNGVPDAGGSASRDAAEPSDAGEVDCPALVASWQEAVRAMDRSCKEAAECFAPGDCDGDCDCKVALGGGSTELAARSAGYASSPAGAMEREFWASCSATWPQVCDCGPAVTDCVDGTCVIKARQCCGCPSADDAGTPDAEPGRADAAAPSQDGGLSAVRDAALPLWIDAGVADWRGPCAGDEDCHLVDYGCCGCANGGSSTAVLTVLVPDWEAINLAVCRASPKTGCCAVWECEGVQARCVAGRCAAEGAAAVTTACGPAEVDLRLLPGRDAGAPLDAGGCAKRCWIDQDCAGGGDSLACVDTGLYDGCGYFKLETCAPKP